MDSKAILDAVADVIRERFEELERLVAAAKIKAIEDAGPGRVLVVLGDGTTFPMQLSAGPPGTQGDRGERGEPGIGIERVVDGDETFTFGMSNGSEVEVAKVVGPAGPKGDSGERGERGDRGDQGERGERGDAGERGERGADGTDRFVIAPRRIRDGDNVERNDLVYFAGGILQATRATTRDPASDPASYVPIINGIDAVRIVDNVAQRTYDITARLTDGTEFTQRVKAQPRFLADGPAEGERVIRGDQFVRGDWLYTATADDADPETANPETNPQMVGWRRQHIRGKRGSSGERGLTGERGPAGRGIAAIDALGDVLVVKMTDGEEQFVPLQQVSAA